MKIKIFIALTFFLTILACTSQTLKEQDAAYYNSMKKIVAEFEPIFNPIAPVVDNYIKDKSKKKDLEVEAEKLRKQLISLQKRINGIKPAKGQEPNHKYILERMKNLESFADDLIRFAGGNNDMLLWSKDDLESGYTTILLDIFNDIKKYKE